MTTPPMVTIWPSYTNQEDAMTTPTPRTDALTKRMAGELDRPMLQQNHFIELCDHSRQLERDLAAAQAELAQERERADKAEELAKRSTARLVEMSDPGFIGAFAARDHWKERAERAEARAENYRKDAEFGQILMRYIDRLTDPTTEDSLEKIVGLLSADVHAAIDAAIAEGKKP